MAVRLRRREGATARATTLLAAGLFCLGLLTASLMLIPEQDAPFLGIELIVVAVAVWARVTSTSVAAGRIRYFTLSSGLALGSIRLVAGRIGGRRSAEEFV